MKCKNCGKELLESTEIAIIKIRDLAITPERPDVIEVDITCDSCQAEMFAYISDEDLILAD